MTPACQFHGCGQPAVWQLRAGCACPGYRCDDCRTRTERILEHVRRERPQGGECVKCQQRIDLAGAWWAPLDRQIEADIEAAFDGLTIELCGFAGCRRPADWRLRKPCGHVDAYCDTCRPLYLRGLQKLAEDPVQPAFRCAGTGLSWPWSKLTDWQAIE